MPLTLTTVRHLAGLTVADQRQARLGSDRPLDTQAGFYDWLVLFWFADLPGRLQPELRQQISCHDFANCWLIDAEQDGLLTLIENGAGRGLVSVATPAGQALLAAHPRAVTLYAATLAWLEQRLPLANDQRLANYTYLARTWCDLRQQGHPLPTELAAARTAHPGAFPSARLLHGDAELLAGIWANLHRLQAELAPLVDRLAPRAAGG